MKFFCIFLLLLLSWINHQPEQTIGHGRRLASINLGRCNRLFSFLKSDQLLSVYEVEDILYLIRKHESQSLTQRQRGWILEQLARQQKLEKSKSNYLNFLLKKSVLKKSELLEREIAQLEASIRPAQPHHLLIKLRQLISNKSELSESETKQLSDTLNRTLLDQTSKDVTKIGGKLPANYIYANRFFPLEKLSLELQKKYPHSLYFNSKGFPNFNAYTKVTVEIEVSGVRRLDFAQSKKAAGMEKTPEGWTWHHHEDGRSMQLVPLDLHDSVKHTGGVAFMTIDIKRINGKIPIGAEYAGSYFPVGKLPRGLRHFYPKGIYYKKNGHPELAPYAQQVVEIQQTGVKRLDFALANQAAGFDKVPARKTWYPHENGRSMFLLPLSLLKAIPYSSPY